MEAIYRVLRYRGNVEAIYRVLRYRVNVEAIYLGPRLGAPVPLAVR